MSEHIRFNEKNGGLKTQVNLGNMGFKRIYLQMTVKKH